MSEAKLPTGWTLDIENKNQKIGIVKLKDILSESRKLRKILIK